MASKNWQAGGKVVIPAQAIVCLIGTLVPFGAAQAEANGFAPASYIGSADPEVIWEMLICGIVICSFLAAVALWIFTALRKVKRSQLRRNAFVSSALNNLNHGVVMTDSRKRIVYCNDRYLELYGLARSDIPPHMTGPELLVLRRARGVLDVSPADFYANASTPEGLITELPGGRSVLVRYFSLPNGGSVATHEDCTEQRKLSRQLASTKQFLESLLDNVPVCVAAKSIEDGSYIFANSAYENFWQFSRDYVVGKRADDLFPQGSAAKIEAADRGALESQDGLFHNEFEVERSGEKRLVASTRIVARNANGQPEFLLILFEDITERQQLSRELESTKKFLEL